MRTTVTTVRGKDREILLADPNFVYIGRSCWGWKRSPWANPFRVQRMRMPGSDGSCCRSVAEAVARYIDYFAENKHYLPPVETLRGKVLGCWCCEWDGIHEPAPPCHGVILAKLADGKLL